MRARAGSIIALAGLASLGVAGWLLWPTGSAPVSLRTPPPDDDLEMLAAMLDAAGPRIADLLVAGPSDLYFARGADGMIEAQPVRGGEPRVVARIGTPVQGMALAGESLWITTGHSVERVAVGGGAIAVVTDRLAHPHAIATDGQWVFVVDVEAAPTGMLRGSVVTRVPAAGGEATVLGRYQGEVTNVALDDANAYWADRLDGSIVSVAKACTATRVLATDRGLPGQVVVSGETLAWVEKRSESIWAMPRTGGVPHQLAQDFAGFAHVVVVGASVVWSGESPVDSMLHMLEVPIGGGEVSTVGPEVGSIDAIATDGSKLFWLREGNAALVPVHE